MKAVQTQQFWFQNVFESSHSQKWTTEPHLPHCDFSLSFPSSSFTLSFFSVQAAGVGSFFEPSLNASSSPRLHRSHSLTNCLLPFLTLSMHPALASLATHVPGRSAFWFLCLFLSLSGHRGPSTAVGPQWNDMIFSGYRRRNCSWRNVLSSRQSLRGKCSWAA